MCVWVCVWIDLPYVYMVEKAGASVSIGVSAV